MRRRVLTALFLALAAVAVVQAAELAPAPKDASLERRKPGGSALVPDRPATSREKDRVWSGLVFATNAANPKDAPVELREFAPRLKRVFGYNQFELAGSAAKTIDDDGEGWLVPSQNFWLSVRARPAMSKEARGGYLLNLLLYHDQRPLVDTEAKLAPGSPLFIRGPACGKGQLIIVLQVQR